MPKKNNQAKDNKESEESLKRQIASVKKLVKEKLNEGALTEEQIKRYEKINEEYDKGSTSLKDWQLHLHDIDNSLDEVTDDLNSIAQSFKHSLQELQNQNITLNAQKTAYRKISGVARELANIRKGASEYTDKELKGFGKKIKAQKDSLEFQMLTVEAGSAQHTQLADTLKNIKKVEAGYKEISKVNKKINNDLGFTPKILGGIDKSLQKLGFGDLGIDDAVKKTKSMGQAAAAMKKPFSAVGTFTKIIGSNLKDSISATKIFEVAIAAVVVAFKKLDKITGDIAANIGISYEESSQLTEKWNDLAISSESTFVTTKSLSESFGALNKNLSNSTNFSDEMLEDFTQLSKQADISSEALGVIAKITAATGGDMTDITAEFEGQVALLNAQNKTSMSEKQVLEEITKISAATTLTLGMQPKELAKAVYQAKALGLEMAQVESIASGLLDFESSIQNELEAELLIGREINLEKARQYALEGDIGKVAEEVAKQIGSAADFTKMNVIQQEALAKSVGMTRNDLAKSLTEREALAKLGGKEGTALERYNELVAEGLSQDEIALKLGDEKLHKQLHSESVQSRFNSALEKAQEVFVAIADDMSPLMSHLADGAMWLGKWFARSKEILYVAGGIWTVFKGWTTTLGIISGIKSAILVTEKLMGKESDKNLIKEGTKLTILEGESIAQTVQTVQKTAGNTAAGAGIAAESTKAGIMATQAAAATTTNAMATFGIGTVIAVGAVMAALAALGTYMFMKDGVIGPGGNPILTGEKGSIQLDSEDSMIVGTDLGGKKQSKKEIIQETSITSREQLQEAKKQNTLLEELMNKTTILVENTQKLKQLDNVGFYEVQ